jgi:hypothetical protein
LLTCQSNRFLDNSSNAFTITVNGTPSVQAFSPFLPTAAYDAAVVGGSGYFDGSGDYITATNNAAYNFGTGNFTVECWVYVTAFAENATDVIVSNYQDSTNGWTVGIFGSTNKFYFAIAGDSGQLDATSALQKNTWVHLAAVRSSTTMSFFINGTREATATNSTNNTSTSVLTIGASVGGGGLNFNGYLSGLRVVKGTAVYDPTQSTLTLPTAPPTAITNTSLLLNYTNAGIYDSAAKNVLETVGNAQVSTTQAKWGTTSISLDGTGDWLLLPSSQNVGFGTGDFTIEFWYYTSTTSGFRGLFSTSTTDSETGTFRAYLNNANTGMTLKIGSTDTNFTQTLTANAWVHIAFVRSSGTLAMYYNGTKNGTTASITTDILAKPLIIGANFIAGTEPFTGYIDDFRISKYARYTATFTPPTAAFPLQ